MDKELLQKMYDRLGRAEEFSNGEPDKTLCLIGMVKMDLLRLIKSPTVGKEPGE